MYIIESFMYIHIIIDLFSTQKKMQLFRGYNRQHHITNVTWHTAPKNHYHLNCFPPSFWCKSMGNWRQKRPERPNFLPSGMTFVALSLVVAEDSEDWKSLSPLSPSWGDIDKEIWQPWSRWKIQDWLEKRAWKFIQGWAAETDFWKSWLFYGGKMWKKGCRGWLTECFVVRYNSEQFLPSFRIPTQLEKIRKLSWKSRNETARSSGGGALVAPKDLIFRLFLLLI